jgi:hypothetical protein
VNRRQFHRLRDVRILRFQPDFADVSPYEVRVRRAESRGSIWEGGSFAMLFCQGAGGAASDMRDMRDYAIH